MKNRCKLISGNLHIIIILEIIMKSKNKFHNKILILKKKVLQMKIENQRWIKSSELKKGQFSV